MSINTRTRSRRAKDATPAAAVTAAPAAQLSVISQAQMDTDNMHVNIETMDDPVANATLVTDARVAASPVSTGSPSSLGEQLENIQVELRRGLMIRDGELQPRHAESLPRPAPDLGVNHQTPSVVAAAPKMSTPARSVPPKTASTKVAPIFVPKMSVGFTDLPTVVNPVNVQGTIPRTDQSEASSRRNFADGESDTELSAIELARLIREDLKSRGISSTLLDEFVDRQVLNQIASRIARPARVETVAVAPKAPVKAPYPFASGQIAIPSANPQKIGNLDQARKTKNLEPFDPNSTAYTPKIWLQTLKGACEDNGLDNRQSITLFWEFLKGPPLTLFNSRFDARTACMSQVEEWFNAAYPTATPRFQSQTLIRNCKWDLKRPASSFIAEFNHCFVDHPNCDDNTKIHLLLEKLPPMMRTQIELQMDRLDGYMGVTQWIVDHKSLKFLDVPGTYSNINVMDVVPARTEPAHDPQVSTSSQDDFAAMLNVLRSAGVCFACGKRGHLARNCRNKNNNRGKGNQGPQQKGNKPYLGKRKRDADD